MWGIGGVLANVVFNTSHATPAWLVSMRLTWAGIAMLIFAIVTKQPLLRVWHNKAHAIRLLLFGLIGVALAQFTYLLAIFLWECGVGHDHVIPGAGDDHGGHLCARTHDA